MRRTDDERFKGSVFVEFSDASTVDILLNSDPKPSWNGEPLFIMTKKAYCDTKIEDRDLMGKGGQECTDDYRQGFNAFREMARVKEKEEKEKEKEKEEEEKPRGLWLDFINLFIGNRWT